MYLQFSKQVILYVIKTQFHCLQQMGFDYVVDNYKYVDGTNAAAYVYNFKLPLCIYISNYNLYIYSAGASYGGYMVNYIIYLCGVHRNLFIHNMHIRLIGSVETTFQTSLRLL